MHKNNSYALILVSLVVGSLLIITTSSEPVQALENTIINAEDISGYMQKYDYNIYPPITETTYLGSYTVQVGQRYYTGSSGSYSLVDNYTPLEWDVYPAESVHFQAATTNDSDTSYIYTSTENEIDLFELGDIPDDQDISRVKIYARVRRPDGTFGTVYLVLQTYGTNYFGDSIGVGTSYTLSSSAEWSTNPHTNENWTKAEVDNLKVGIKSGATDNEIRCTHIYVWVYWKQYLQFRGFFSFDTSNIPDYATVESAELYLAIQSTIYTATDFDVYFYSGESQWTDTSDLAWEDCSDNQGIFFNTSGKAKDIYYSQTVAQNAVNKTGKTQFRLTSAREESLTKPTGTEYILFYKYDDATFKPYLEITYSTASSATNLLCEGQTNPIKITDLSPEFSAIGYDPEGDQLASYALQIDNDSNLSSPVYNKGKTAITPFDNGVRCDDISYENSDLVRGTTYYWRIKFWDNNDDEQAWSTESATFRINQLPIAENQEVENQTNPNRLVTLIPTLSWDYCDIDGDTQENYWVQVGTSENDNSMWDNNDNSSDNFVTYGGLSLSRGTEYHWRVKVYDNCEWSENWLYGGTFQINQLPTTENAKTEGFVNPENVDTQTPTFTWDYFDNDGDSQSNWQIQVGLSENENDKWDYIGTGDDVSDTYVGSPLDDSVTYYVRVRTKDSYEWSSWDNGTFKTSFNTLPQIVWIVVDNVLVDRKQDDGNTNPTLQTRITVRGWDNENRDDLISCLLSVTDNDGNFILENENITNVHENIDNNTQDFYYNYNPLDTIDNTALGGFKVKAILTDGSGDNAYENFIEIKFYVDDLTVTIENSIFGENLNISGNVSRVSGISISLDNVYLEDNVEGSIGTTGNYDNTYRPAVDGKVYAKANANDVLDGVSDNVTYVVINLLIENSYFGGTQDNATLWVELKYSDEVPLENVSIQLTENSLRVVFDNENRISWTFDLQDDNENIQLTLENVIDNRTDKVVYMGYVKDNVLYVENTTATFEIYGRTKSIYYGEYGFFTGSIISRTNWINLDLEGKMERDGFLADGENYLVEPQETVAWALSHNPTETMDYVLGFYGSLYQSWTVSIFVERRTGSPGSPAYHPSYFLKFEVVDTFLAPLIAEIELYRDAMLIKSAYTNQAGIHSFYLPAGDYSVEISKEGYETATIPEFVLGADVAMDQIVLEETLPEPPKGVELPIGIMGASAVAIGIVVVAYILLIEVGKRKVPKQ